MTRGEIEVSYNATISGDPEEVRKVVRTLQRIEEEPDLRPLIHDIMEIRDAVDEFGPAEKHEIRENTDFSKELDSGETSEVLAVMKRYGVITNRRPNSSNWVLPD